ncbi:MULTISPECIES: tRNA (adenosine(37)-N6)-threonylcarbamoyltransferase complex dimerization subunit type 1 TsaB [Microbacterium]|uniref:tRNA (Adenosine(37)-N6)-threonylcarbamoyltransferase complex dimerization subunit type 1 TsaB n=1 Tax=Microbacterium hominis TaxID=162426 RepID=A0A2K9DTP5_9MICO|nr:MULTISPECIES: tRNA (adenosine(37)-N6)-threonylcarbamoyltransferase complex dimerization subunit type 1 TsaB [Microbacterium]AUG30616.1 tRNA (adenosine(37)-N6)-threonylcarbamoyltransferase complex dimerization subunit type 1 TsaB [Microbacterium hominis]
MILGIDTSLGTAVGIVDPDGAVRAESASANPLGHAEVIGDLLRQALVEAERGPLGQTGVSEPVVLTHVAVGMGPGPFTGLRVGIAAARAFALARELPVVAVPSHDAAALEILLATALVDPFAEPERFAVVTDARRREVAYSVYEGVDADGIPIRTDGPALSPRADIDDLLARIGAVRRDVAAVSAAVLAVLAARAVAAGRTLAGPEPLYLRAPDVTLPRSAAARPSGAAG